MAPNQGLIRFLEKLQTGEGWNACMAPKAIGAYNLDRISRKLHHLEHFVMWSSFVANAGNEGEPPRPSCNAQHPLNAKMHTTAVVPESRSWAHCLVT